MALRSLLLLLASAAMLVAQKRPFDVNALLELKRVGDPQLSPDGRWVAFTVQSIDVQANKRPQQVWIMPLTGGAPRQITRDGEANHRPRWSPDSKRIAYISDRGGSSQIWLMDPDGGNPAQVTNLSTEADGVLFTPDGKHLLFTSSVFPECGADEACNKKLVDEEKSSKVKARIYTELLYRHWTAWSSKRRSHLMVVPVAEKAAVRDLTPGARDVPPFSLGGQDDYDISPDGKEVCFTMNADPVPAVSTNSDLYVVAIAGGDAVKITPNTGADASPKYSPDGKYLAWRAQTRGGYESDRWRLMVLERSLGRLGSVTENLPNWVNSFTWSPDSTNLFFTTTDRGRQNIQMISVNGGAARIVVSGDGDADDMQFTRDAKMMVYAQHSAIAPTEIYRVASTGGEPVAMTRLNDTVLNAAQMTPLEEIFVTVPDGARIHSFIVKPAGFQTGRKYPVLMLIHGGPQGFWGHAWTYRWNAQIFAAAGYVVVMPNPRGSTGYGQKFVDEINNDWGGRAYDDIMAVTDHVTNNLPYVDRERVAAAGASYGGYMINWILGHTQRFKALVSHAGLFDIASMFGATEELWFPLWEFGGPPWEKPEDYAKWSPKAWVKEFKTPTLVVHGELDFRVPYDQGLQLFTALQLQKVPSKLLLFPDEGHWIQKPQNAVLWYKTVIDWLDSWVKK
jgi:dipeptidyl aminopeptidase/acylaminoacyl peptidase